MTKWSQDHFSIREAPKTTDVQFHSGISDRDLNLDLQCECYILLVLVGSSKKERL